MSKIFIDTNILVYTQDTHDPTKNKIAREVLREISRNKSGVISTQVLQEFYVASTKKLKSDPILTKQLIKGFTNFELVTVTFEMIEESINISIHNKLSFWDSLIISTAVSAKCDTLLSEDMNHAQMIEGVKIENPFDT